MAASAKRRSLDRSRAMDILSKLICSNAPVLFVTGAGISAASGIPTFRKSPDALWSPQTLQYGTRRSFLRDSLRWYNDFWLTNFIPWRALSDARPNDAHIALARIAERHPRVKIITQNVDSLHCVEPAVIPRSQFLRAHGVADMYRCENACRLSGISACTSGDISLNLYDFVDKVPARNQKDIKNQFSLPERIDHIPLCTTCETGKLRPACLLFDEDYDDDIWSTFVAWLQECEALVIVGTSNMVGLTNFGLSNVADRNIPIFNFNLTRDNVSSRRYDVFHVLGPAETTLPGLDELVRKQEMHL